MSPDSPATRERLASAYPAGSDASSLIIQSWQRSEAAGVPRDGVPRFVRIPPDELQRRQSANELLITVAAPHLRWVSKWLSERPHVVYLVDPDGVVLIADGDPHLIEQFGLSPGHDWSERRMGTNGAGTALIARRPVAIVGCDHWADVWHNATCLAAPVFGPDGELLGAVDISMDVREGDEHRLIIAAHMAHAIEHDVARTMRQAAAIARDEFLTTVAHELRQPLQGAMAAVHVMEHRPSRERGEHARQALQRQLQHMSRVINDLVDGLRLARGHVDLRFERIDLCEVVRDAADVIRSAVDERGLTFEIVCPDDPLWVQGDRARIQQVLTNLLGNAAKFTDRPGRVCLTVARRDARSATVRIVDTGMGIDPLVLPTIFELFKRGTNDRPGFGIGLAIARRLIELHGGTVEAHSEGMGRGSEFVVTLPTDAPGVAAADSR